MSTAQNRDTQDIATKPENWLERYGDALYRYAFARLRDKAQAEDAVQECLLAALNARSDYRAESSEKTWLFGILKHKILDQFRRNAREVQISADDEADALIDRSFDVSGRWRQPPGVWQDPGNEVEHSQFWAMLEHCMDGLPKTLSAAIRLIEIDDVSSEEACKALGISATNLWVRLHRARLGLRGCVQSNWFSKSSRRSQQK